MPKACSWSDLEPGYRLGPAAPLSPAPSALGARLFPQPVWAGVCAPVGQPHSTAIKLGPATRPRGGAQLWPSPSPGLAPDCATFPGLCPTAVHWKVSCAGPCCPRRSLLVPSVGPCHPLLRQSHAVPQLSQPGARTQADLPAWTPTPGALAHVLGQRSLPGRLGV